MLPIHVLAQATANQPTALEPFDLLWWIVKVVVLAIVLLGVLTTMAYETYFERKVMGRMQNRFGPTRTGPAGLLQPAADALKLLIKETVIPARADKYVFWIAPVISFFTAVTAFAVAPFGRPNTPLPFSDRTFNPFIADVNIAVLLLLALSSFGVYGIIMGGWSSNNKYALLGGLRSSAQVISYEITMGISLIGCLLMAGTMSLQGIILWQDSHLWFILLQPVAFITYLTSGIAETNRNPFDLAEGESELVAGYHVEYSSMHFGLFFLAEYINMLTIGVITASMFFGGWAGPLGFLDGPIWMVGKIFAVIFFYFWIRSTLPRFRYDQLMGLCWKVFLPVILLNILITSFTKQLLTSLLGGDGLTAADGSRNWIGLAVMVGVQAVWFGIFVTYLSRSASISFFGRSKKVSLAQDTPRLVPAGVAAMAGDRTIRLGSGVGDGR